MSSPIVTGCGLPIFGIETCQENPEIFYSHEASATCPMGTSGGPFTSPSGKFTSFISQEDADSQATAYLNSLLSTQCHILYYNTLLNYTCPAGSTGSPVTVPAGTFSSLISIAEANAQALAYAISQTVCVPDDLNPFDFAVIRYSWTDLDGEDLDTGTSFTNLDPLYNNLPVGFCWSDQFGNGPSVGPINSPTHQPYLLWGGDNTTPTGDEAVLFNAKQIGIDYPLLVSLTVNLTTNWYGIRLSGNLQIEFATYLGGTMTQVGTDFINSGGVLVDSITVDRNSVVIDTTCSSVDQQGTLVYNFSTKTGTITNP